MKSLNTSPIISQSGSEECDTVERLTCYLCTNKYFLEALDKRSSITVLLSLLLAFVALQGAQGSGGEVY
jgi:hypothetical protein